MRNIKLSVLAGLVLSSSVVFGATGTIKGSPHDLATMNAADNGELCIYCHTPHAGNTIGFVPIWNKVANNTTFTMYGAAAASTAGETIAGTATDATPASPSLACLSCHDGVSSIDSIVNAPGSGLGNLSAGTAALDMETMTATSSWLLSTTSNLTNDLAKTHPISIVYGGTGTGIEAASDSPASLRPSTASLAAVMTDIGDANTAWVVGGTGTVGDLLRNTRVECSSCHDPHNGYGSSGTLDLYGTGGTARTTEVNFLRHTNKGSALCLGCHDK